jgi:hypothetical protein
VSGIGWCCWIASVITFSSALVLTFGAARCASVVVVAPNKQRHAAIIVLIASPFEETKSVTGYNDWQAV